MTKARPRRDRTEPEIDEESWRFLCDAVTAEDLAGWLNITLVFNLDDKGVVAPPTGKTTSELWAQFGADVLAWWIKENPGTRPWCWWKFAAPEPRRRVGGVGVTNREACGFDVYIADYGLPDSENWMMSAPFLPQSESGFPVFDPTNPPLFESQASYLMRLALFESGEEKRLKRNAIDPVQALPSLHRHGRPRLSRPDLAPMIVPER
jgi:hypothetical protein